MRPLPFLFFALAACGSACGSTTDGPRASSATPGTAERPEGCPAQGPAPEPLPGVRPEHRRLAYWLEQSGRYGDIDAELMSPARIRAHDAALLLGDDPIRQPDLTRPERAALLQTQVHERIAFIREKLQSGEYVDAEGERITGASLAPFASEVSLPSGAPVLRVALASIPLRCGPRREAFYTPSLDMDFDRNNCSTIHAQEPVTILGEMSGMLLAQTPYALGWIAPDAPLSPEVPAARRAAILDEPRQILRGEARFPGTDVALPPGTSVAAAEGKLLLATSAGFQVIASPVPTTPTARALTRRAFLEEAFSMQGEPYGWGGREGGRDCSRFLLDVFARFGLQLPRHSSRQAMAGTFMVEVPEMNPSTKAHLIEEAQKRGIVLLHFPGHIMLYLGEDASGTPMALHSFSEYVEPCADQASGPTGDGQETIRRVDRIAVSDLTLGASSSRGDFLSRITHVTVLGLDPGPALRGAAKMRPAAPVGVPEQCEDHLDASIFRSPARPHPRVPLRVIATATEGHGPVELALFDPNGRRVEVETHELGGPPFTRWARVDAPEPGRWTAVLGDGNAVIACEHFTVARGPGAVESHSPGSAAWIPTWAWERDTENLYSAFVEQLFRAPEGDDITWPNLQVLLADPERNLLFDHQTPGEDEQLALQPDCADLPYFLRGYFAWKLRLPFAWRQCRRGRDGQAPTCAERPKTNLDPVAANSDLGAFRELIREVANNIHSSTDRTTPNDEFTDVYPVPLEPYALRPGTVYADPYGHVLVVARWIPQGLDEYGVLLAADAQPDGTVGRRRFWRGSFLFTPDTSSAGAGFKTWRPPVYDRPTQAITLLDNAALRASDDHTRWSDQQYRGSQDDFYDTVDQLINPRPLDPAAVQRTLVDALDESVTRRLLSVDLGEEWVTHNRRNMPMPEGAAIFQTSGPWEDFATPSRDLRLLISIDAVIDFPDAVQRSPERFGLAPAETEEAVARAREVLSTELAARTTTYRRSDGSEQTVTLQDIVDRRADFEMSYNPNDCMEIRWAAPEGTPERSTCRRRAPAEQTARMRTYRTWFHTRSRPPR